ncbi:uncharacterized protein B0H64DRAFT_375398 [Chaetomium fimeti]|uniref:Uncharacterized protein n=1 Tax=Chaetomium fimeti TaxID=1854472 RepID=A0AAE0HE60_9PEZI|nr:hypothetical protein B0H64DRAFT_375398 [Chaetomium fimeti]
MSTPIPIAFVNKHSLLARFIRDELLPDFDVVKTCHDLTDAGMDLRRCCDDPQAPSSHQGVGSNEEVDLKDRKAPRAVVIGLGLDEQETTTLQDMIERAVSGLVVVRVKVDYELEEAVVAMIPDLRNQLHKLVEDGTIKRE